MSSLMFYQIDRLTNFSTTSLLKLLCDSGNDLVQPLSLLNTCQLCWKHTWTFAGRIESPLAISDTVIPASPRRP